MVRDWDVTPVFPDTLTLNGLLMCFSYTLNPYNGAQGQDNHNYYSEVGGLETHSTWTNQVANVNPAGHSLGGLPSLKTETVS